MPRPASALEGMFGAIEGLRAQLARQLDREGTEATLALVRTLVERLPHRYLMAATKTEIQLAGRTMLSEGHSRDEMRALQGALVAFFDHAVRAGATSHHPLRDSDPIVLDRQLAPETALVVARRADQAQAIRTILQPIAVQVHAELADDVAMDKVGWFPFMYLLCAYPFATVPPVTFLEAVRGTGSLCRTAGLVLMVPDEQVDSAMRFVGRGANRVVGFSRLPTDLPAAMSELGAVSKRVRLDVYARASWDDGKRSELWQAENVSTTGMLLRTPTQLPRGNEVVLEFKLPGEAQTIKARTVVVRHTTLGRENVFGLGVRFLSFEEDGQRRLEFFQRKSAL